MKAKGFTPYHAKYLAAIIRRKHPMDSVDRLIPVLYDADIEIHAHQVSTAAAILNSPLSKGSILADEEGLGKSIEAAIVMSFRWQKGRNKQILIAPISQLEAWRKLLITKFGLPAQIVDDEFVEKKSKRKKKKILEMKKIVICSYKFAYEHELLLQDVEWDFVIIDEAHRLKNIYDIKSAIGDSIRASILPHRKLLITSTPFQSTMKRLFRLANLVDKYTFGDQRSFNYQFVSITDDIDYDDLTKRLSYIMSRTEGKRVPDFMEKARRYEIVVEYEGTDIEKDYLTAMENYFMDSTKFGFPSEKSSLQALALFKQMTLSPKIAMGGLGIVSEGLEMLKDGEPHDEHLIKRFGEDIETLDWIADEWFKEHTEALDIKDFKSIRKDIKEEQKNLLLLREYVLAVKKDSRIEAFFKGLDKAEAMIKGQRGKKRIIVYTESLQAQKYLSFMLKDSRKKGVYSINGTNLDDESEQIYKRFLKNKKYKNLVTGEEDLDRRTAILREFDSKGKILIATDKGMADQELEHCYVLINYDLPLDPYRVQLRQSKVHGHANPKDLIIVNIVNVENGFEHWNYQKQTDVFDLFTGVHGRSDVPIGAIGVGTDYAMRIFGYYMKSTTIHLVERSFRRINIQIKEAKSPSLRGYYTKLILPSARKEREKWKVFMDEFNPKMDLLLDGVLTINKIMTKGFGTVSSRGSGKLNLRRKPFRMGKENLGEYYFDMIRKPNRRKFYINSKFGGQIINKAFRQRLTINKLRFSYRSVKPRKKSLIEFKGKSGVLEARLVNIKGMQEEEHIVFAGITEEGYVLTQEQARDLMELSAKDLGPVRISGSFNILFKENVDGLIKTLTSRDEGYIVDFSEKLDLWINDRILVHKKDLRIIMTQKRKLHRRWINTKSDRKKMKLENQLLEVGVFRRKKRRYIRKIIKYSSEEKEQIISRMGQDVKYNYKSQKLFTIWWELK